MNDAPIIEHVNERTWSALERARKHCANLISKAQSICDDFLAKKGLDLEEACCVVVGSVGRSEALDASDLDFTPVLRSNEALVRFDPYDKELREAVRSELNIKVSEGKDLTKRVSLDELTERETIGGEKDSSGTLTKRILILTEGKQAGGKLPLNTVREEIMRAYAGAHRTRGRHVLSLCNDIARYYRTLCIEYKVKADDFAKDWCTRNMKLRHSRKLWYFSCLISIVHIADSNPKGDDAYIVGLLEAFDKSPIQRIFNAVSAEHRGLAGRIINAYAWFLDFMSKREHREKLEKVSHEKRYEMSLDNPFHAIKLNSHRLHQELLALIDSLPTHQRHRIIDWFLL